MNSKTHKAAQAISDRRVRTHSVILAAHPEGIPLLNPLESKNTSRGNGDCQWLGSGSGSSGNDDISSSTSKRLLREVLLLTITMCACGTPSWTGAAVCKLRAALCVCVCTVALSPATSHRQ